MSGNGCELMTVTPTSRAGICNSSSRRAAPTAAHRPGKPEPSTTTFFTDVPTPPTYRSTTIQNCASVAWLPPTSEGRTSKLRVGPLTAEQPGQTRAGQWALLGLAGDEKPEHQVHCRRDAVLLGDEGRSSRPLRLLP